jgi:hypothetical protein
MTNQETRRIFKSSSASLAELHELFEFLFVGELLAPSADLWLVSPWVSDINILDNRAGTYDALLPEAGRRPIRLSEVLLHLMRAGTRLHLVVKPDEHNETILRKLGELALDWSVTENFHLQRREHLHMKGVLTANALVSGSMNVTYNGVQLNEEMIAFDTNPRIVAEARLNFEKLYGGSQ